ncbi:hypothetical protein EI427_00710 [Flammeovirga pectinis]|uniref:Lipoprotein n=1 Tax=Flammeovirga pectinis TaxID=2494373 RepID=A0A3S9NXU5_9BACT|nr:hypothetical protein [Flammeovirga pectinis]AZQ60781.1 hypothetical protein EI427_00710 [Flammeovirga pectinis]
MKNLFTAFRLLTITTLISVSFLSCNNDDYDDDDYKRTHGNYTNRNKHPNEVLPPGCHWEWDDNHWERDCD